MSPCTKKRIQSIEWRVSFEIWVHGPDAFYLHPTDQPCRFCGRRFGCWTVGHLPVVERRKGEIEELCYPKPRRWGLYTTFQHMKSKKAQRRRVPSLFGQYIPFRVGVHA